MLRPNELHLKAEMDFSPAAAIDMYTARPLEDLEPSCPSFVSDNCFYGVVFPAAAIDMYTEDLLEPPCPSFVSDDSFFL